MSEASVGVLPARLFATSRRIQGFISGGVTSSPSNGQVLAYHCVVVPGQIRLVLAAAMTTHSQDTILDVHKNGSSVWKDPAHRPTLAGGQKGNFTTYQPDRGDVRP